MCFTGPLHVSAQLRTSEVSSLKCSARISFWLGHGSGSMRESAGLFVPCARMHGGRCRRLLTFQVTAEISHAELHGKVSTCLFIIVEMLVPPASSQGSAWHLGAN